MTKRKSIFGKPAYGVGIIIVLAMFLVLAGCENPAGDNPGPSGSGTISVSGTVTVADLEDLGLETGGSAVIEFRDSGGQVVAQGTIGDTGSWTAQIPDEYAEAELTMFLVISSPEDNPDRVFNCGTATINPGDPGSVQPAIPDPDSDGYTIAITTPQYGTCGVPETDVFAGEVITITVTPQGGYGLKELTVAKTGEAEVEVEYLAAGDGTYTFTMPAYNVTVTVEFATPVTAFDLDDLVTAPVAGQTPDTGPIAEDQYTGTIVWQTGEGQDHSNITPFAPVAVYKAVVSLAAKTGWTLEGVAQDAFGYSGALVANAANSGIVTITFPATDPVTVDDFELDALVTPPVAKANPVTTPIDDEQYEGTIAWQTSGGAPHGGAFGYGTAYKAVVTLTAKTGWTFAGVAQDAFGYSGASAANAANSGIVTITFPETEKDPNPQITTQPAGFLVTPQAAVATSLTVVAAAATGETLGYQWFSAENPSGPWVEIPGEESDTYTPAITQVGTKYYKVVVTNTVKSVSTDSEVAQVTVFPAANLLWDDIQTPNVADNNVAIATEPGTASIGPYQTIVTSTMSSAGLYQFFLYFSASKNFSTTVAPGGGGEATKGTLHMSIWTDGFSAEGGENVGVELHKGQGYNGSSSFLGIIYQEWFQEKQWVDIEIPCSSFTGTGDWADTGFLYIWAQDRPAGGVIKIKDLFIY
jgi:hypothetical protein